MPGTDTTKAPATEARTAIESIRRTNIQVRSLALPASPPANTRFVLDKRGRDRDVEYKNYSNNKKAKTRERSSSDEEHKEADRLYDKARYGDRDAIRRAPEKERRFGDWKEMVSKGSGKKYYYNERDKSSQWEKPEEWTEYEM